MGKQILCVDFDGVVHSYSSGWKGADVIPDPPVEGALEWLWIASKHWDVQIYSSRSKEPAACFAMLDWMQRYSRLKWEYPHVMRGDIIGLPYPITFCHEKPPAFLTIDDRAICFDGNWADLDPIALLNFKPWNKREVLGATGNFPDGKLNENDEGELRMAVGQHDGYVRLEFGTPVAWLALPPDEARELATLLRHHANVLDIVKTNS